MNTPTPSPNSKFTQLPLFDTPESDLAPKPEPAAEPGFGTPRMKSPQRDQWQFVETRLDDLVPSDCSVRAVWKIIDSSDLSQLYAEIQAVEGGVGRDAIDPKILMCLWLFATIEGVSSAREIERLAKRDNYYRWICGGVSVNRTTLSRFYTARPEAIEKVLIEYTASLMDEGLVNLNRVSVDGTRVRANASKSSFRREQTLSELAIEAEEQVNRLAQEREASGDSTAKNLKARESDAADLARRIEAARQQIPEIAKIRETRKKGDGVNARASTTDPDARTMKMANGGFNPALNVQFATDNESGIIVHSDVTNCGGDMGLFTPIIRKIQADYGKVPNTGMADGGYASYEDIEAATTLGVTVLMPVREEEKKREKGIDPFEPLKSDSPALAAWRKRMGTAEAKELYKERAATAEWVNAQARNRNLQQFRVRGLKKAKCVAYWYAMAHNVIQGERLRALKNRKAI